MAKKSASAKKKPVKKGTTKVPTKKAASSSKKLAPKKESKKPVNKPAGKTESPKKENKKTSAAVKMPKADPKKSSINEKAQPALMTKKGKSGVEEVEVTNEIQPKYVEREAEQDVKAEKISKFKPIRVERGNLNDEKSKWAEVFRKYGKEKSATYKMSDTFAAMTPIQHKVLGWGFVLTNDNDRLEVLFETGIRMLISNYKSS